MRIWRTLCDEDEQDGAEQVEAMENYVLTLKQEYLFLHPDVRLHSHCTKTK